MTVHVPLFPRHAARAGSLAVLALVLALPSAGAAPPNASSTGLAGTYRIEGWQDLEARGLYHFFYLDPGGRFFLAGEWKDNESSRFGGTWSAAGETVRLTGTADVSTNQGRWTVPFQRTFRVERSAKGLRLVPVPEKNRFGLMGWPNGFVFFAPGAVVNVPGGILPADPQQLLRLGETLPPPAK